MANSKAGGGGRPPLFAQFFSQKAAFSHIKRRYSSSLCAFAINDDGADTLSAAPTPFNFLDSPLVMQAL